MDLDRLPHSLMPIAQKVFDELEAEAKEVLGGRLFLSQGAWVGKSGDPKVNRAAIRAYLPFACRQAGNADCTPADFERILRGELRPLAYVTQPVESPLDQARSSFDRDAARRTGAFDRRGRERYYPGADLPEVHDVTERYRPPAFDRVADGEAEFSFL